MFLFCGRKVLLDGKRPYIVIEKLQGDMVVIQSIINPKKQLTVNRSRLESAIKW